MHLADGVLLTLALAVGLSIGRRSSRATRMVLLGSALMISAAFFLPSSLLRAVLGPGALASLESVAGVFSWELADVVHFIAFLWLALMLWTLRPDLRGWRAVAGLLVLASAAELVQGLTVERSPRLDDVAVNLLGAGCGLLLAVVYLALGQAIRSRRIRGP